MTNKDEMLRTIKTYKAAFYKELVVAETENNVFTIWDSNEERKNKFVHTGLIYLLQSNHDVSMYLKNDVCLGKIVLIITVH